MTRKRDLAAQSYLKGNDWRPTTGPTVKRFAL